MPSSCALSEEEPASPVRRPATTARTRHQSLPRHSGPCARPTAWTRPGGRVEEVSEVSPKRMRIPAGVAAARKFQLSLKRFHTMDTTAAGPAITDRMKAAPEPCRAHSSVRTRRVRSDPATRRARPMAASTCPERSREPRSVGTSTA